VLFEVAGQIGEDDATAADGIVGAKDDAPKAVKQERAETHQARLERSVAGHLFSARPKLNWNAFQCFDFGVMARLVNRREHGFAAGADDAVINVITAPIGRLPSFSPILLNQVVKLF